MSDAHFIPALVLIKPSDITSLGDKYPNFLNADSVSIVVRGSKPTGGGSMAYEVSDLFLRGLITAVIRQASRSESSKS